ncbi:ornithine cyclodeaminase family protein [Psychromonas sp. PT13]|uniref:ornithine cyclodeaminase family protein n=1 Tax=Psychromonas sp. PT13 TaxID=3439547 RepID=UPI003EC0C3AD
MESNTKDLMAHNTEPLILKNKDINELLPKLNVQEIMKSLFLALSEDKAVQPPQSLTLFPEDKGDFIAYLGAMSQQEVFGTKLSPYLVTTDKPVITAWTSLMSMRTGQPLLWCDSGQLTIERTAGTTALAVNYLAPKNSRHLAIIGTGSVGQSHLRHVKGLRDWQTITVFSPELANDKQLQSELIAMGSRISISDSTTNCVKNADVIMLCTSSATPVISLDDIKSSAVVTSISTNALNAHEVPPELLHKADVYCDYKLTTPSSAGEMCIATSDLGWDPSLIKGDLTELVAQSCSLPKYDKPVFFRSIGLGLEDVAMAYGIWQLANQ